MPSILTMCTELEFPRPFPVTFMKNSSPENQSLAGRKSLRTFWWPMNGRTAARPAGRRPRTFWFTKWRPTEAVYPSLQFQKEPVLTSLRSPKDALHPRCNSAPVGSRRLHKHSEETFDPTTLGGCSEFAHCRFERSKSPTLFSTIRFYSIPSEAKSYLDT